MARRLLTLDALKEFDLGKIDVAFANELQKVVRDMRDRPSLAKARKVTLELELVPQESATGDCETAQMTFTVSSKIPKYSSRTYETGVQKNCDLLFNDMSHDDIRQGTLDELEDKSE